MYRSSETPTCTIHRDLLNIRPGEGWVYIPGTHPSNATPPYSEPGTRKKPETMMSRIASTR